MPDTDVVLRRCAIVHIEPEETLVFDPIRLLGGDDGLVPQVEWRALAPHLPHAVGLDEGELHALREVSALAWKPRAAVEAAIGADRTASLLAKGLLLCRGSDDPAALLRDEGLRDTHWHPGAAVAHAFSRWSDNDADAARREARPDAVQEMVDRFGGPPPHFHRRADAARRVVLAPAARTGVDDLLAHRATCRNFDPLHVLPAATLSAMLKRAFGAHGVEELAPGAVAVKKNHPSGGALHPVEAYLIVQRAEGLATGLYHYNVEAHALDLLRELNPTEARALATTAVARQGFFADAPVMVVMAARFARSFWKYRAHPKIYRAILLETGHISQNIYLTATEMDIGAFITAAINEVEVEQAFGLQSMQEGPLAICGFGPRAQRKTTVEFDPLGAVWDETGQRR